MPEGPEILNFAVLLSKILVNKPIFEMKSLATGRYSNVNPVGYDAFINDMNEMGSCLVKEVDVKGKFMWWKLAFTHEGHMFREKNWWLWITHGMYAKWTHDETKHSAFVVSYKDPEFTSSLFFNDKRHYGTLKFVSSEKDHQKKLASLGPDMLKNAPEFDEFAMRIRKHSKKTLPEVLMNQSVISGIGNYVKAESLYLACLSPHRTVDSLDDSDIERLLQQIVNVMKTSYDSGGWPINAYKKANDTSIDLNSRFMVYGNKIDPEGRVVITEETKDGRVTHWCPEIQH